MDPQQQFCLKWNSYSSNLAMTFSNLFKSDLLADVTLSCNGTVFKAHKLILAACSKKFAELFETAPTNGQCVVILEATSPENMSALLEFMYKGEVHVSQEALNSFLKSAENLQVKGLSTEHGRLAAAQSQSHESQLDSLIGRRQQRNNLSGGSSGNSHSGANNNGSGSGGSHLDLSSLKQECDSLMHPSSSGLGGISQYISPIYRPLSFDPPRKRHFRSPFPDQGIRGSVLRDGSKGSAESASPVSKHYRPSSSASSNAPTEADTMQSERVSPQSRYENHSPPSTTAGTGNDRQNRSGRTEHNNGSTNEANDDDKDERESNDVRIDDKDSSEKSFASKTVAEDLRVKMELDYSPQPTSNAAPPIPTALGEFKNNEGVLPANLSSIAPADMLSVWNATKLNHKNNPGKKLKCPFCDRLYGYETNLRAHIKQRHQGIRVPCPFCGKSFTRNNTVRRHIAREHKQAIGLEDPHQQSQDPSQEQQNHAQ